MKIHSIQHNLSFHLAVTVFLGLGAVSARLPAADEHAAAADKAGERANAETAQAPSTPEGIIAAMSEGDERVIGSFTIHKFKNGTFSACDSNSTSCLSGLTPEAVLRKVNETSSPFATTAFSAMPKSKASSKLTSFPKAQSTAPAAAAPAKPPHAPVVRTQDEYNKAIAEVPPGTKMIIFSYGDLDECRYCRMLAGKGSPAEQAEFTNHWKGKTVQELAEKYNGKVAFIDMDISGRLIDGKTSWAHDFFYKSVYPTDPRTAMPRSLAYKVKDGAKPDDADALQYVDGKVGDALWPGQFMETDPKAQALIR